MKKILILAIVVAVFAPALFGQSDPAIRDTVRLGSFSQADSPWPAQITIPVYCFADDSIGGFSLGFIYNSALGIGTDIEINSVIVNAAAFPSGESVFIQATLLPDENKVVIGGADFSPVTSPWGMWTPAEKIFDLVFDISNQTASEQVVVVDSSFVVQSTFVLTVKTHVGTVGFSITPEFLRGEINLGALGVLDLDGPTLPLEYSISQNHPNPFNPTTIIDFSVPKSGDVKLEIFNILGQKVATLADEHLDAGYKRVEWDSTDDSGNPVASGVYLYRLTAGDFSATKKMVLMK